jgi:hypothetical protein
MSFYKRYELAKMVREGEVKTFSGFEIATRRPIYLHLFEDIASHPALSRLMQMVRQAEAAGQVIEVGEFGGTYYVVTDPFERFTSLRDYLEANPPVAATSKAADPAPASSEPSRLRTPTPTPPKFPQADIRPLPSATPAAPAESETVVFGRQGEGRSTASPIFETWPSPPTPIRSGSRNRTPAAEPVQLPPAATPRPLTQPPLPPIPPQAEPQGLEVGDFTRLFSSEPPRANTFPLPFADSMQPGSEVSETLNSVPVRPDVQAQSHDFPTAPLPAAPPLPAPSAKAARTRVLLVLAGGLGIILVALIIWLVLRR